jgi:antitoxin YefM
VNEKRGHFVKICTLTHFPDPIFLCPSITPVGAHLTFWKKSRHYTPVHYPVHMHAITYTAARENLASTMSRVCSDHNPVIITRKRDQAVIMMSLEDYESLQETAYLLRSPANAKRLSEGIEQLERGEGVMKELSELL